MDRCRENGCLICVCEYFTTVVRVIGVILAIVLWVIGINALGSVDGAGAGIYAIFLAVVVSILEGLFLFETCITGCCENDGCCAKTWKVVLFVDNWKRSILYAALSVPCFFLVLWTVITAGVLMVIMAVLYLGRSFKIYRKTKDTEGNTADRGFRNKASSDVSTVKTQEYPPADVTQEMGHKADEEMSKRGDAGFGSWEERYPQ